MTKIDILCIIYGIAMFIFACYVNESWAKDYGKLNDAWYERCKKINNDWFNICDKLTKENKELDKKELDKIEGMKHACDCGQLDADEDGALEFMKGMK